MELEVQMADGSFRLAISLQAMQKRSRHDVRRQCLCILCPHISSPLAYLSVCLCAPLSSMPLACIEGFGNFFLS